MPESMSSWGELTAPPLRITSPEAVTCWVTPAASRYSTPVARVPSNRIRWAYAAVRTVRLRRRLAGCTYASAALFRSPRRWVTGAGENPVLDGSFSSSRRCRPNSAQAGQERHCRRIRVRSSVMNRRAGPRSGCPDRRTHLDYGIHMWEKDSQPTVQLAPGDLDHYSSSGFPGWRKHASLWV
jgi:hypothetical protein